MRNQYTMAELLNTHTLWSDHTAGCNTSMYCDEVVHRLVACTASKSSTYEGHCKAQEGQHCLVTGLRYVSQHIQKALLCRVVYTPLIRCTSFTEILYSGDLDDLTAVLCHDQCGLSYDL